ncbi:MAG: hypothetical protein LBD67_05705 [Candidatus Accumulibacter sp.]|jgi:hypothetical protein|nr:hypothetical protein [Accumulibacter sp.]
MGASSAHFFSTCLSIRTAFWKSACPGAFKPDLEKSVHTSTGSARTDFSLALHTLFIIPPFDTLAQDRQGEWIFSPFVLSLSKHERTLSLSSPDSFYEWFFNPYPSTRFLRQAQDSQGAD